MKTLKTDLWYFITQDAGVSALIGTKLYPTQAPQNVAAPYVTFQTLNPEFTMAHDGPTGDRSVTVQFNIVAGNPILLENIGDAITAALVPAGGLRQSIGASNTTFIGRASIDNNIDLGFNADTNEFEKALDFSLKYNH